MRFRQGSDQRSDPELDHEGHQASQTGEEGNIKENKRIPQLYRYVFGVEISMSMRKMGPGRSALWLALLLMGCLVHSAEPQRSDEAGSGSAGSGEVSGSAGSGEDSGSAGSEEDTGSAGSGEVSGSAGSGEDSGSAGSGEVSGSAGSGEDSGSAGSGEDSGSAGSGEDSSSKESGEESSSTESGESSSKESGESSSKESGESSSKESEESSSKESGEESSSKESGEESSSKESGESSSKESEESSSKESGEESSSKESGEESSSKESGEESSSKESGEESSSKESGEESSSKESGEESSSKESGESSSKESGEESSSKESGEESSSKESGESSSKESGESSSKESEESSSKESGEESSSKESGESSSKESGESSSKESGESSSKESGESSSKESGESSSKESGESSSKESGESSSKESGESSSQESGESGSQESGGNSGRSSSSGCDPGWSHHGSKCYKVASGTFTYAEAEAKCTELNAQPALSKDRATNDFIVRLRNSADSSQPVWIGLKFENAGGFFFLQTRRARWIDGELLSDGNFDDWADGEPNDEPGRDADCVRIHQTDGDNPGWSDQWRDYPCDRETLGVICETEARPAGECSADKGVCSASGDPHYTTFDGRRHHFQGYCSYTFAKDCGDNSVFTVETKNVPLTVRPVAVVREVYVKAYGFEIGILQRKKVTVDGKAASLPISVADGNIEVHLSGRYVRVRLTDLCVEVFYDGRHRVKVEVPDNYKDRMCGLCGNYNDNPGDDFIKADGTTAPNWTEFGNSHLTDMSTCPGGDIGPTAGAAQPECDDSLNAEVSAADKCGLLKDAGGPFAPGHGQVDPSGAFDDCVFDMCARDGDVEGLCENLEAYADASREAGVDAFAWRTADRCPLECPENSAYSLCTSACPATCTTPDAPDSCSRGCVEGCECAEGFVLSGLDCVPQEQCGCTDDEGRYYVVEESWEEDGKDCACREGNSIVCEDTDGCSPSPCDPNAECQDVAAPDTGATCTCNDGYEGDGEADGSGCTAVQCSPPTAPENGALSSEGETSFDYQDEVTFSCNQGYELDGAASVTCQADREWSAPVPTCEPVQCSPPTAPENGALSPEGETSYDYQDEVAFSCNQGYELDGAASVTCQADREWSAPVPTCEHSALDGGTGMDWLVFGAVGWCSGAVQCSPPTAPENGALSPEGATSYDYQDEVTFSCNQGYELDGAASVTCQADQQWSAPVPACEPVQCSPPTAPENGALSPEGPTSFDYQDEVTFSCNQGYELDGAASLTCQADREWSAAVPACKQNGALSPEGETSYDYQDEVTFSCNQGYELDGASSVTCQADREWSAPVPTCEPVQCSPPSAPENGALSPEGATSYDYQDEVTFSCNPGYELDGATSVTCQADGEWSAPVPTCEPVQCSPPTAPENGALSSEGATSYDYQDEVTFTCNQGYGLDGAASVTCQADRQWSAPLPTCKPVQCSPPTAPENGALSPEGATSYDYQDEVTFSCNPGYELDGAASVMCQADREWSAPVPTCEPVQCSPPTAPENGALSPEGAESYDYQDEVTFSCNPGYELDGAASVTCQADQQWSAPVPACEPVQCSPPTAPENGALSPEGATSFDYQDEVTFTCNPGYELDGAASVMCQADREWSASVPTCEPVLADIEESDDDDDTHGGMCDPNPCYNGAACTDGDDAFTCTCLPGFAGEWCGININECDPDPCENGGACTDGVASYTCDCAAGFEGAQCEINIDDCDPNPCQNGGACTDAVDSYTCDCTPGFEGDRCETDIDGCSPDPCVPNAECQDNAAPETGATCTCNDGYEGDGQIEGTGCTDTDGCSPSPCDPNAECQDVAAPDTGATCTCNDGYEGDGEADGSGCTAVQCSPPTAPENGALSSEGATSYDYQDEVEFSCNQGYELDGAASVTCQADQQWSAPVPTCNPVQCGALTAPAHGTLSAADATSYQDVVQVTCEHGYELDGASSVTCQADGTWSEPLPACQAVQCATPSAPENGALSPEGGDSFDYQDEVTFSCNPGYDQEGSSSVTCQADKEWSEPIPTCKPVQCSPPTAPENGALSPEGETSYDYQDEITFSCNQGYELDGAASVTCQADQQWSAPAPTCKRIDRCDPNPCQNEGACNDVADSYTCECEAGFEGDQCEINIDDCTPDLCKNGGVCTDGDNSFLCECAAGFHGPTCELVITKSTCVAYGDPHHETLDGASHDFQGTCRYTLTKDLGPDADFNVEVQEVPLPWLTSASVVREVYMEVHGYRIDIRQQKIVSVDEKIRSLPFSLDGGKIQVELSGLFVHIRTDLGVELFYDGKHYAKVVVPSNYQEQVGGLCGNYNGDPSDDFTTRDGAVVSDVNTFGRTWLTSVATCPGGIIGPVGEPPSCDEDIRATAESAERCGLIKEPNGPFAVCHDAVDPQRFFNSCVFDMCARNGDMVGLCEDFETYADACVDAGVHSFFWRTHSLCPGQCPANSRYSSCTSFCPATCARDTANDCDRDHDCVEGCECNPGFILSGQSCVPVDQCGCTHSDGRYFALGERFGEDDKNCVCAKGNDITCEASGCDEDGSCDDVDICQTVDCGQKRECKETPGGYECACKKPFKEVEGSCRGFFTYSVVTRLLANEFYDELYDSNSEEFKNLVKEVRNAVKDLYGKGELTKNEFLDMDIREFVPGSIIAHYQLYLLDDSALVREAGDDVPYILQETLKKLAKAHNGTHLMIEHEEGHQVSDHDECASPVDNDCSPFATCRNMVGNFKCACLDGYEDRSAEFEDPPGRVCQKAGMAASPTVYMWVVVAVVLGLLAAVLVLLAWRVRLARARTENRKYMGGPKDTAPIMTAPYTA
ncbi:CSMD1 [Branchiostoma lanceolatum]|uniref:CSMD1 protein n=1 Tax=Branchiostoma lanceolatum TaxID=7740 RepID=A0A8K0EYG5_BRALA|nr:CSMD1 [Branchiostoma lanceolatum]